MQRKLREQRFAEHWHPPFVFDARRHFANLRREFRRVARWWELNALRRYAYQPDDNGLQSWERDLQYAHNYRWFVELMDAGRRVTADAHGVYVDGELASKVQDRERRAEQRKRRTEERWAETARREGERPENPYRARAVAASDGSGYGGRR
jgi:hypothetical protein